MVTVRIVLNRGLVVVLFPLHLNSRDDFKGTFERKFHQLCTVTVMYDLSIRELECPLSGHPVAFIYYFTSKNFPMYFGGIPQHSYYCCELPLSPVCCGIPPKYMGKFLEQPSAMVVCYNCTNQWI